MNQSSRIAITLCFPAVTLALAPQVRSQEADSGARWLLDDGRALIEAPEAPR